MKKNDSPFRVVCFKVSFEPSKLLRSESVFAVGVVSVQNDKVRVAVGERVVHAVGYVLIVRSGLRKEILERVCAALMIACRHKQSRVCVIFNHCVESKAPLQVVFAVVRHIAAVYDKAVIFKAVVGGKRVEHLFGYVIV